MSPPLGARSPASASMRWSNEAAGNSCSAQRHASRGATFTRGCGRNDVGMLFDELFDAPHEKGAVVWPAASIARVLLCGTDARRRETNPGITRSATSGCDRSDALAPEVVAHDADIAHERPDLRHVVDGWRVERDAACIVTARPGVEFSRHQLPVDPRQELTCSRQPGLLEPSTGIDDRDRPCRQKAVMRALREMAFADQRELKKIAIGEQRVADHHTSPILQRVDKRANRQPTGASALTGNPTVLSLLRLEPIASRGLP